MTETRYRAQNNREVTTIRRNTPTGSDTAMREGIARMIPKDAQVASRDASMYFQMADSTGAMPKRIGLPAYQNAGIVRIQYDTVQATAIPAGPQGSARRNIRAVTTNSTTPQRNPRSARPIETWIQPC